MNYEDHITMNYEDYNKQFYEDHINNELRRSHKQWITKIT